MDVSRPSIDRAGRVVYVGSFSKVMLPMLRLGFLGFPGLAPTSLRAAKQLADWSGKRQLKLRWLDSSAKGCWPGTSRKASREYAARRQRIVDVLQRDFAIRLELVPSAAGLHVAARGGRDPWPSPVTDATSSS